MKTKNQILSLIGALNLFFFAAQACAGEENTIVALGKLMENPANHTTKHNHELRFLRLSDGRNFDIVDSTELLKAHCETERNPVVEIKGYLTDRFLFWGGNLVVTDFKLHQDIEVPRLAHVKPETVSRSGHGTRGNARI